jgi:hypothetical protein
MKKTNYNLDGKTKDGYGNYKEAIYQNGKYKEYIRYQEDPTSVCFSDLFWGSLLDTDRASQLLHYISVLQTRFN